MLGLPSSHQGAAVGHAQGAAVGHAQGAGVTSGAHEGADERQADGSFETQCLGLSTHGRLAPMTCVVAGAASDVALHASCPFQGASIPPPMSASQHSCLSSAAVLPPARPPNYLHLQQQHRMPPRATSRPPPPMGRGTSGRGGGTFLGGNDASGIVLLAHVRVPLSALHVVLLVARPSLLARCLTAFAGIIWGPRPWRLGAREDDRRGERGRGAEWGRADGHGDGMEREGGGRRCRLLLSNSMIPPLLPLAYFPACAFHPSLAPLSESLFLLPIGWAIEQGRIEGDGEGEMEGEAGGHTSVQEHEQVPLAATPPPITPVASSPMPCLPALAATTRTHQPCTALAPLPANPAPPVGGPPVAVPHTPPPSPLPISAPPSSLTLLTAESDAAAPSRRPHHHPDLKPVNEQQPHRMHSQRFPHCSSSLPSHTCHPLPHLPIVLPASPCVPHVGLAQQLSVVAWERVLAAMAEGRQVDAALWMTCQALLAATLAAGSMLGRCL
ncbi:unnamed protein product [Closterium sp. NIES-65]|nr:unnamed protein product [Closterium sp. NIES-65]